MFIFKQKKNYPSPLSWNIIKILQTCYFRYFGHTWPRPPKAIACRKLMVICKQKTNLITQFFCRYYYILKNPAIWLTRTKIQQGMGFAMESQKTNQKISKKEGKIPYFLGPLCLNLDKNQFSTKIGLHHFLASIIP